MNSYLQSLRKDKPIVILLFQTTDQQIVCPECRQLTCVSNRDLPINFQMLKLVNFFEHGYDPTFCSCCQNSIVDSVYFSCKTCTKNVVCALCCVRDHKNHELDEQRFATSEEIKNASYFIDEQFAAALHRIYSLEELWDLSSLHASIIERTIIMFDMYEELASKVTFPRLMYNEYNQLNDAVISVGSLFSEMIKNIEDHRKKMLELCLKEISNFVEAVEVIYDTLGDVNRGATTSGGLFTC
ncbi:hypothetical protein DICVIV_04200 [Dictyocaulus viviparus]|uniref:Uncharacterized protein n=1 Tax=Dictyocaulus viviparus TaxID=29172 RepID=A0A0D8Y0S6_DICVI|nr:hypothetical protein DICVIV_04200 [Dictyocaulus viviparus]